MATASPSQSMSVEEFERLPDRKRYELVDGKLVEKNMSNRSMLIATNVIFKLKIYLDQNNLGYVYTPDAGYRCFGDGRRSVRFPDVSVVLADRVTIEQLDEDGFSDQPPDLAVEVVSPNDTVFDLEVKVHEYLRAGVRQVWVIIPATRTARIYQPDGTSIGLNTQGMLEGGDLLPGFAVPLASLFPPQPTPTSNR